MEGCGVSRLRLVSALALALIIAVAVFNHDRGSSSPQRAGSGEGGASRKGSPTGRVAPVVTAKAQSEDFRIARRTIGILESPAIVVVKSRIDSQVLEQPVIDGQ